MFNNEALGAGFEAFLQGLQKSDTPHDVDGWDGVNHELWQNGWESANEYVDQWGGLNRVRIQLSGKGC